ncbi:MAG: DUF4302 domain-containing protein [Prevotella sp.]|nr:DUF4302 domain-containing protein [Prevotella sp.]
MIKKLLNMTLLMAALTTYTACNDNDDIADPTVRLTQAMNSCKDILTAAPNGWAMTMYGDLDFGGFNVLCKLDKDGKVTVANELFTEKSGADTTAVTHYKFEQSSGIILSFDEYCELFHYFSDPVNPDGFRSETENGFGGDLEFRIISASSDSVVMRGKKHDTKIVMTPLPTTPGVVTDSVWAEYLRNVAAVAKEMQKGNYYMIMGTDSLKLKANRRNRVLSYTTVDSAGINSSHNIPYIITPKGITFYRPFEFGGQAVKGFNYVAGSEKYQQEGGSSIVLEKFTPDLNQQLVEGAWYITETGLGTRANTYWRTFRNALLTAENFVIYYALVGTARNNFGLTIGPVDKDEPTGIFLTEAYFDYEFIGTDEIRMWFNGGYDGMGNGEYLAENCKLDFAIFPFGGRGEGTAKTFKIETDNEKDPTYLRLTDKNDKNNVITLSAEQVVYPFGK